MSRMGRVSRTCACQAAKPGRQCSGEAEPRVELVELESGHGVDVAVATTVFSAGGRVSGPRYWSMMARTRMGNRQSMPAASGWSALGTVTAYAAAIVAFAYALMSLYWALGGHGLVSTIGGYVEQFARRGGILPVVIALAATLAKVAGGLLALALVRPWGLAVPRRWLLAGSAVASALSGGVRRFERAAWCPRSLGCHPPDGKRRPDGAALARRGLGPVVPGVGDLAGAGYRRLLAPDGNETSA
jgi:hypothetical protein